MFKALGLTMLCAIALSTTAGAAGIQKWVDEDGKVHYGDRPPENVETEAMRSKAGRLSAAPKIEASDVAAKPVEDVEAGDLIGAWCLAALSMDIDGEKTPDNVATWTFSDSGELSVEEGGIRFTAQYTVGDSEIQTDNDMIGDYGLETFGGATMVMSGPWGGYYHMERRGC